MAGSAKFCAVFVLLVGVLMMSGCLVTGSSDVTYSGKGQMVGSETLGQIEPGKSTKSFVKALLGDPSEQRKIDEISELYTYDYIKTKSDGAAVFLLFALSSSEKHHTRVYVEFKEDIVQRVWKESTVQ